MMLPTRLKRLFTFHTLLPTIFSVVVSAQQCYYPNGDVSKTDAPCSSAEGAACCPLNWQCLDNGLCYLDSEKYFGRYTCTDKSWKSSACPGFCTNNNKDSGNQAVQQCSNHGGQYCCDQNRDASNVCCNRNDDTPFFVLPRGNPTATIASLGGPAKATTGSSNADSSDNDANNNNNNQNPATINPPTNPVLTSISIPTNPVLTSISIPPNPATTLRTPPPASSATVTRSSTASNPNGQTSIILITSIIPSTPSPSAPSTTGAAPAALPAPSSGSNNTTSAAAIGGGVGGGVAALLALALLAFYLRRRHQRRKASEISAATMPPPRTDAHEGGMEYMYKNQAAKDGTPYTGSTLQGEGASPEIDGVEVVGRKVGGFRPGEKTRVDVEGGKGLGLEREGVSELPGEDVPWSRGAPAPPPGQLDGEGVDKWRAYQIAAGRGRP
ncbi:hypothetical protein XANCAGTX0491_009957 [Xanthoria calcicola]